MGGTGGRRRRLLDAGVALVIVAATVLTGATASRAAARATPLVRAVVSAPADSAALTGERYLAPVFTDVSVRKGIFYKRARNAYGVDVDLYLDLYEPVGDTERRRPLVIWAHGGWFAIGGRGNGDVYEALSWARRGYSVASISYRLDYDNGWLGYQSVLQGFDNPRFMASWRNAADDMGSAIEFFRSRPDAFGVNPDAIFSSGHSAGAMASLHNAYLDNGPGAPRHRPQAVIALSGTSLELPAPGDPPTMMFHGTSDTIVPYAHAVAACRAADATDVGCVMDSILNAPHFPFWMTDAMMTRANAFQFDRVLAPLGYTTVALPVTTGVITGTVSDIRGPIGDQLVVVSASDVPQAARVAVTSAAGAFTVAGLVPGDYKVAVLDGAEVAGASDHHVAEFYDNRGSTLDDFDRATVVSVKSGVTTSLKPMVLAYNHPGAVRGTVGGASGPLAGMVTVLTPVDEARPVAFAVTGPDGTFTIGNLPPGGYKLITVDLAITAGTTGYFIPEFYDNAGTTIDAFTAATTITIRAGTTSSVRAIGLDHTP